MKTLTEQALSDILQGSQTIEKDGHGIKVARLSNGNFLKIFRKRSLLSVLAHGLPAIRFHENSQKLLAMGIPAPQVNELLQVPARGLNCVNYQPLPGDTLRQRWAALASDQRADEVRCFGSFLGHLHQNGVYFRSLHLGNVLRLPDEGFGLIDLSDMRISGSPISPWKRKRNLAHMKRYEEDAQWLFRMHVDALLNGYAEKCGQDAASALGRYL